MDPAIWPFVIVEAADFHKELTLKDDNGDVVPLAGGAAVMTITSKETDPETEITLSTVGGADGTITLADTAPNIILHLPNSETTDIVWENGTYDLYITPSGGIKDRYLEGPINVRQRIV